jgi:hypothetical protein
MISMKQPKEGLTPSVWRLARPMPADVLRVARVAAG